MTLIALSVSVSFRSRFSRRGSLCSGPVLRRSRPTRTTHRSRRLPPRPIGRRNAVASQTGPGGGPCPYPQAVAGNVAAGPETGRAVPVEAVAAMLLQTGAIELGVEQVDTRASGTWTQRGTPCACGPRLRSCRTVSREPAGRRNRIEQTLRSRQPCCHQRPKRPRTFRPP